MKLLGDYIKSRRGVLLFFALTAVLLGVSFALFHLPLRAVAYPCALALLLGLAALALDFRRVYKLHRELSQLETTAAELIGVLPQDETVYEYDCDGKPSSQVPDSTPVKQALHQIMRDLNL